MGGKGRTPPPPEPIDPGQSMGEYLFGRDFQSNYQGVTDPRLQQRLLGAEREFRPQYSALELQDINTFLTGIPATPATEATQTLRQTGVAPQGLSREAAIDQLKREGIEAPTARDVGLPQGYFVDKNTGTIRFKGRGVKLGKGGSEIADARLKKLQDAYEFNIRKAQRQSGTQAGTQAGATAGTPGTKGLFDLLEESGKRAIGLQQLGRQADVESLQKFAPQVVEAYRAADPASTALAEQTTRRAMGQLTPEEEMNINQQARQASLARGRIGDESSVAGELMQREQFKSQFTPQAFQMNRALAGDLGATILGRPSQSLGLGSSILGQATGLAGQPVGPQLFDPNMGLNMAMQQRSQDMNLLGAQMQARATQGAGMAGLGGSIMGGLMGMPK